MDSTYADICSDSSGGIGSRSQAERVLLEKRLIFPERELKRNELKLRWRGLESRQLLSNGLQLLRNIGGEFEDLRRIKSGGPGGDRWMHKHM